MSALARRRAIVARAMEREGIDASMIKPAQAGFGPGSAGGSAPAAQWDVRIIRLPITSQQRSQEAALSQATGRFVVESLQQKPQVGWGITWNDEDGDADGDNETTARILTVDEIPTGNAAVCYICGVQEGAR